MKKKKRKEKETVEPLSFVKPFTLMVLGDEMNEIASLVMSKIMTFTKRKSESFKISIFRYYLCVGLVGFIDFVIIC